VGTPLNTWQYQYQLPTDFILASGVNGSLNYEIYGDKLYSNDSEIELDYIYRADESLMPVWFQQVLEYNLAFKFAIPVTGTSSKQESYYTLFMKELVRAKNIDSSSRTNNAVISSPFVEVRE